MPTCQNCGKDWNWKQTVKRSFTLGTGMKCPYCESKQYFTTKARRRSSLLSFIVPLLILLPWLFELSIPAIISIFIDRKSTRLNSSHVASSYAVFCLKKNRNALRLDRVLFSAEQ